MMFPSVLVRFCLSTPSEESGSIVLPPDWQLFIYFLLLVFIVVWLLLRSTQYSAAEAGAYGHGEEHATAHAAIHGAATERHSTLQVVEPAKPDDLVMIEGIGPKISSVLNAAGIYTFAQLAEAEPERLREILLAQGLRLANPDTWPDQAKLASAGDWEAFNALTGQLKGGRRD